jgi:hypothetical protein
LPRAASPVYLPGPPLDQYFASSGMPFVYNSMKLDPALRPRPCLNPLPLIAVPPADPPPPLTLVQSSKDSECSPHQRLVWQNVLRSLVLPIQQCITMLLFIASASFMHVTYSCVTIIATHVRAPAIEWHLQLSRLKRIHTLRTISGRGILHLCLLPSLRLRTRTLLCDHYSDTR